MQLFGERNGQQDRGADSRAIGPTTPPRIRRRIALTRKQRIGIPLMTLVPLLALFGAFGERSATVAATSPSLAVSVRYPVRFRYRQTEPLAITVRNRSSRTIDTIDVSLDTAYMTRFANVRITPEPRTAFTVELTAVKPGEQRLVVAELEGERYGRHRGRIVAAAPNDSAVVTMRTLVFP
jgi:hypothetical protein